MTTVDDATRENAQTIAALAAELYGALLAVEVPDPTRRGIGNFDKPQAFELLRTVFYEAIKDADLL